jgi:hypothetical protein
VRFLRHRHGRTVDALSVVFAGRNLPTLRGYGLIDINGSTKHGVLDVEDDDGIKDVYALAHQMVGNCARAWRRSEPSRQWHSNFAATRLRLLQLPLRLSARAARQDRREEESWAKHWNDFVRVRAKVRSRRSEISPIFPDYETLLRKWDTWSA